MMNSSITYADKARFSMSPESSREPGCRSQRVSVQLSRDFERLNLRLHHVRPGMSLFLCDFTPDRDMVVPFEVDKGAVSFHTVLSDRSGGHVQQKAGHSDLSLSTPCDTIFKTDQCQGETIFKGGTAMRSVSLQFQAEYLLGFLEKTGLMNSTLYKEVKKQKGMHQIAAFAASPQTQLIATQILAFPHTGPLRELYMESKGLELLYHILDRAYQNKKPATLSLTRSDVERLHEARCILFEHMADPPGLKELAQKTGLNEFKLKRGFREVFGCTPYEALRTHRMYAARTLLQDSDNTVGTVAAMVGYTNMSHFIVAFRDVFGVTPGSLLRHSRRSSANAVGNSPTTHHFR